jgi:hypothetical protein
MKAEFNVGQVAVIRGYLEHDPRALGIVKSVSPDGMSVKLWLDLSGNMETLSYSIGDLRPLTQREQRGGAQGRDDER